MIQQIQGRYRANTGMWLTDAHTKWNMYMEIHKLGMYMADSRVLPLVSDFAHAVWLCGENEVIGGSSSSC